MKTTYKTARTIKPYEVECLGYKIIIPTGSIVSNSTACGYDDNYRFWADYREIAENLTGFKDSYLAHRLNYYGVNIPAEYCEEYKNEP